MSNRSLHHALLVCLLLVGCGRGQQGQPQPAGPSSIRAARPEGNASSGITMNDSPLGPFAAELAARKQLKNLGGEIYFLHEDGRAKSVNFSSDTAATDDDLALLAHFAGARGG